MEIMWLGHAAVRLQGSSQTIYIDPVAMEYTGARAKHLFDAPEPADIILVTHEHTDHCNPDSFKRMRTAATIVVGPAGCKDKVRGLLQQIAPGQTLTFGSTTVRAVPAYNVKREREPGVPFHPRGLGVGYIVTVDGVTVYHAGDTEPVPELADAGPVDVALVPVDGQYTMSPEEAMQCATAVKARQVIPMHYFDTPVSSVLAAATATQSSGVHVLEVGETMTLDKNTPQ